MRNVIDNFAFGNRYDWSDPFTIVIDTRNTKTGGSAANEFLFPQNNDTLDGYINFLVDWGDGQFSRIRSKAEAKIPHTYSSPGVYTLNFYKPKSAGTLQLGLRYESYQNETHKLLKILNWGKFNNSRACFANCINLDVSEADPIPAFLSNGERNFLNCVNITRFKVLDNILINGTFARFFEGCISLNQSCVLNAPNVLYAVQNFQGCISLNSRITFNAPKATNLSGFFYGCSTLNVLPILNTPNVTNVSELFKGCTEFNKNVSTLLDWSKVSDMTSFMTGKTSSNYDAANYDKLLIELDKAGQTGVPLGMGTIKHTSAGIAAKNSLVAKQWIITDGGII